MDASTITKKLKEKLIKELETELQQIQSDRVGRNTEISNLQIEINQMMENLRKIKDEIKNEKKKCLSLEKIRRDIEILKYLEEEIQKIDIQEGCPKTVEVLIEAFEKDILIDLERKKDLENELKELKEKILTYIKEVNSQFMFTGTRKRQLGLSYNDLKNLLRSRQMISKDIDIDWDSVEKYCDHLEEIGNIVEAKAQNTRLIEWLQRNAEILPKEINITSIQESIKDKEDILAKIEQMTIKAKNVEQEIKEKKKEQKELEGIEKKHRIPEKLISLQGKIKKINSINSFEELGLSREEALKKIEIESFEYLVIPINKEQETSEGIFDYNKKIEIEIDENKFESTYTKDTATAVINSNYNITDEETAILIPLCEIKKEDVARINDDGSIELRKFDLPPTTKIIKPSDLECKLSEKYDTFSYEIEKGTLKEKIEEFLGEDYTQSADEYKQYKVFDDIENKYNTAGDLERIMAIVKRMDENFFFDLLEKKIKVDGKVTTLNKELANMMYNTNMLDEMMFVLPKIGYHIPKEAKKLIHRIASKEIQTNKILTSLKKEDNIEDAKSSLKKIRSISSKIKSTINREHTNIEQIYKELLMEYMADNPKARAFYNDEKYSKIIIDGKEKSIKPKLPKKEADIEKRLFRKKEDKTYKMMKLAALCNKMAHLYEYETKQILSEDPNIERGSIEYEDIVYGRQKSDNDIINILVSKRRIMFDRKDDLMKEIIQQSKGKENISLGSIYDKRGYGMSMDIPGYTTITLHLREKDKDILDKLDTYKYIDGRTHMESREDSQNMLITSGIMIDGVNREIIEQLRNMKRRERLGVLNRIDLRTLQNLLVRLGYTSKDFGTREGRNQILSEISSDEKLDEILGDDELCR